MANTMQSASTREVDGAYGDEGPIGSEIAEKSGNADHPNEVDANDDLRIVPAPADDDALPVAGPGSEWTGSKTGGQAPPGTSKTH